MQCAFAVAEVRKITANLSQTCGFAVAELSLNLRCPALVICAYGPQRGRPDAEKVRFYDEMGSEWDFGSCSEIIVSLGDFNGHVGKCAEDFEGVHGGMVLGKEMQKEEDCWSFVMKESCAWQILCLKRQTKEKLLIVAVDVKQKLILCLWGKNIESI